MPSIVTIFVVATGAAGVAAMLTDTIGRLWADEPESRVEFSPVFTRVLGVRWGAFSQFLFFLSLFSQNVAAIIGAAQATYVIIASLFGHTCALTLQSGGLELEMWSVKHVIDNAPTDPVPAFSAGYGLCMLFLVPLGFMSLQENMFVQKAGFVLLIALIVQFCIHFWLDAGKGTVAAYGGDQCGLLGVVLFNFAFLVTIPSWLNEKVPKVNPHKVIWYSSGISSIMFIVVGWLGGLVMKSAPENLLTSLIEPSKPMLSRVCGGIFALAIVGFGIPVFCVLMRYNLVAGGVCSERFASAHAAAGP